MSEELSKEKLDLVYEIIEVAKATGKIKKGTNEATKAIENGSAKIVAYAKDVTPPEVVMHIPLICKEKGVTCFGVPSREELGTAAGLVVPTAAVAVTEEGDAKKLMKELIKEPKKEAPKAEEKPAEAKEDKKSEDKPAEKEEKKQEPKAEDKPVEKKEDSKAEPADKEKPKEEKAE